MSKIKYLLLLAAALLLPAGRADAQPIWGLYVTCPYDSTNSSDCYQWIASINSGNNAQINAYAPGGYANAQGQYPQRGAPSLWSDTDTSHAAELIIWVPNTTSLQAVGCVAAPSPSQPCNPTIAQIVTDFEANMTIPSGAVIPAPTTSTLDLNGWGEEVGTIQGQTPCPICSGTESEY